MDADSFEFGNINYLLGNYFVIGGYNKDFGVDIFQFVFYLRKFFGLEDGNFVCLSNNFCRRSG